MRNFLNPNIVEAITRQWLVGNHETLKIVLDKVAKEIAIVAQSNCEDVLSKVFCEPEVDRVMDLMACTLDTLQPYLASIIEDHKKTFYNPDELDLATEMARRVVIALDDYGNLQKLLGHDVSQVQAPVEARKGGAS